VNLIGTVNVLELARAEFLACGGLSFQHRHRMVQEQEPRGRALEQDGIRAVSVRRENDLLLGLSVLKRIGKRDQRRARAGVADRSKERVGKLKKRIQAEEIEKREEQMRSYAVELEEKVRTRTEELSSEKEKLDTIVSAMGSGIVLFDKEGIIQWANQMIREMAGKDVVGMSCEQLCAECDIAGAYSSPDRVETVIMTNLFGRAEEAYLKAISLGRAGADLWFRTGLVRERLGNLDSAVEAFREVLKEAPGTFFSTGQASVSARQ
jgi:PAS domain-containing protein